jgi:hypothetical protein
MNATPVLHKENVAMPRSLSRIIAAMIVAMAAEMGCSPPLPAANKRTHSKQPAVDYELLRDQQINNGSIREVFVRLDKPISKEQLRSLATGIEKVNRQPCPKTKIVFLLPGQGENTGAWAVTVFRGRELEINVIGAPAEQHRLLEGVPVTADGDVAGEWVFDSSTFAQKLCLVRKEGKTSLIKIFGVNETTERELEVLGPTKFREVQNKHGEWIEIDDQGNLAFFDEHGKVDGARRVK